MSGGTFDYKQWELEYMADHIQEYINKNGKEKSRTELYRYHSDPEWYEKYPEDRFHHKYSEATIKEFEKAVEYLRLAKIYVTRIDWLLASDDGEETFHKRLKQEIEAWKHSIKQS